MKRIVLSAAAVLAVAGAASGQETFTFTNVLSSRAVGDAGNDQRMVTFANSFLWGGSVTVNGVLAEINTGTFGSEARFRVETPSNGNGNFAGGWTGTGNFTGTTPVGPATQTATGLTAAPFNVFGQSFNLRFFESFVDAATGADARWDSIAITFNAFTPPTPPACTNLGNVNNSMYPAPSSGTLAAAGQVDWYCFNVAADTVLDMHTFFSGVDGVQTDTELGLYNSFGLQVAVNDDLGGGIPSGLGNFNSGIITGGGSGIDINGDVPGGVLGPGTGTFIPSALPAGTYYLAVGGFNTVFAASNFGVTGGSELGAYNLTLIPAPGSLALLGLGGLIAGRRRRA